MAAIEMLADAIPTQIGEWFTKDPVVLNCPACERNFVTRPMVFWDSDYDCWRACSVCGNCDLDQTDIPVYRRQVEEWGRLGHGWRRADPDPGDPNWFRERPYLKPSNSP